MARRSLPFFFSALLLFLLVALPCTQVRAAATSDLIAHGTADHLWIAQIVKDSTLSPPGYYTRLQGRSIGQPWQNLGRLQGRVAALAHRGTDLAVLFESGDWSLFWPSNGILTSATGQPLPFKGRIITFNSDSRTLWAVVLVNDQPPATQSSAAASTRPATTQSTSAQPTQPMLMSLDFKQWKWINHGPLPRPLQTGAQQALSLAVVNHQPVLAVEKGGTQIQVAQYIPPAATTQPASTRSAATKSALPPVAGVWTPISTIRPDFQFNEFKLLGDSERPGAILLWVAPKTGAGSLYEQTDGRWKDPIQLKADDATQSASQRTIALAAERLRLITQQGDPPTLYAQQFDLTGKPAEAKTSLVPAADRYGQIEFYLEIVMMAALVIAVMGTFYRRRQPPQPLPPDRLPLASLSARFGAGLIDALPILISIVVAAVFLDGQTTFSAANLDPRINWILSGGFFIYLFYTTVMEVIAGRTVGKMILGLRVVTVDGKPADWSALLMRNILRLIDFLLAWFPLALIFYTPLRQRIGDVAAATVVVTNAPIAVAQEEKPQSGDPSPSDKNNSANS